jgi:phage anti-repressor protein
MENFIRKYSNLPKIFVKDFFIIADESYEEDQFAIDFEVICRWLGTKKGDLKRILIKNFSKDVDYMNDIKKVIKKDGGATRKEMIMVTSNCFKELCMISQTNKAKEVRIYFLELEKLVRQYHKEIEEKMKKEFELVKKNQKPKIKNKEKKKGTIYVVQAQNTEVNLYKLGKTQDKEDRLKTYNTGNANDIDTLLDVQVDDIHKVELCVKHEAKKYQYRKYKEVYEINLELLIDLINACDEFSKKITKIYEYHKDKISNMLNRVKIMSKYKLFLIFQEDE